MSVSIALVLQVLTTMASMLVSLSPATDMYKIHKQKSTGPKSILPVIAICCNSHVWMWYGYLKSRFFPLCVTSVFAQLCGSVFISIYYYHSIQKQRVRLMLLAAFCIVAPVVCFAGLTVAGLTGKSVTEAAYALGFVGASFSVSVLASPMERVKIVLRTKSATALPATLCCMSLVNTSLWLTYGAMNSDLFLLVPNSCGVVLCSIQVALCIIYRDKSDAWGGVEVETDATALTLESLESGELEESECSKSGVLSLAITPSSAVSSPKDTCFDPEVSEYAPMRSPRSPLVIAPVNA